MAKKKKEPSENKTSGKLNIKELYKASDDSLPMFVGVLCSMGLQKEYEAEIEKDKKGEELALLTSLEEYKKAKEEWKV